MKIRELDFCLSHGDFINGDFEGFGEWSGDDLLAGLESDLTEFGFFHVD